MNVWIGVALVLIAVVVFVLMRLGRSRDGRTSKADLGAVSQSWLTEQRAYKQSYDR
jgi:hypothetical protein